LIRSFISAVVLLLVPTGWLVITEQASNASVVACVAFGVTIPNTPLVLRQHPCVPLGLDSVPPSPPPVLGNAPAIPLAEADEAEANVCVELSSDVDGLPGVGEAQCQTVPLVAPPAGSVPGLPQVPNPAIPPSIPPIPPHIPGAPALPPLPVPIPAIPPPLL
jgi:hypothetical protein